MELEKEIYGMIEREIGLLDGTIRCDEWGLYGDYVTKFRVKSFLKALRKLLKSFKESHKKLYESF